MSEFRNITRRILTVYRQASPEQVEAGLAWFDRAHREVEQIGARHEVGTEHAVVACAHLSPRQRWSSNLVLLDMLLGNEARPDWALTRSWELAASSLDSEQPMETFGWRARKTKAFAQAILGDRSAVVVDTWIARAAGVSENSIRTQAGYVAVSDAYRRGARRVGLCARDLQAVTWCAIRGAAL